VAAMSMMLSRRMRAGSTSSDAPSGCTGTHTSDV